MKKILSATLCLLITSFSWSQDCDVEIEALKGDYEGDCKKGLAHGKGTANGIDSYIGEFKKGQPHGKGVYTWKNGDVFEGEWNKGLKHGEGKMSYASNDVKEKITSGFWEKDEYIGKYATPYKVWSKSPLVTGVRGEKERDGNEIKVVVNSKGQTVRNAVLDIAPTQGFFAQQVSSSNYVTIDNVQYPFRAVFSYEGEKIDIEFQQPGVWLVTFDFNK